MWTLFLVQTTRDRSNERLVGGAGNDGRPLFGARVSDHRHIQQPHRMSQQIAFAVSTEEQRNQSTFRCSAKSSAQYILCHRTVTLSHIALQLFIQQAGPRRFAGRRHAGIEKNDTNPAHVNTVAKYRGIAGCRTYKKQQFPAYSCVSCTLAKPRENNNKRHQLRKRTNG